MIRGTTPTHVFETDVDISDAVVLYVTYKQGNVIVEKTKEDCEVTSNSISVKLTQKDTLLFKVGNYKTEVQIRARFEDGTAVASNAIPLDVSPILKRGEI